MDTTFFSEADLRRSIEARYTEGLYRRKLNVNLISFGFKHGQVNPVDLLIDLRFIDNPYHVKGLAPFSGLDEKIRIFFVKINLLMIPLIGRKIFANGFYPNTTLKESII